MATAALGQSPAFGPVPVRGSAKELRANLSAARKVARVDHTPKGRIRFRLLKRAVILAGRPFLRRQAIFNSSMLKVVSQLNSDLDLLRTRVGAELARVTTTLATIDVSVENLDARLGALEGKYDLATTELSGSLDGLRTSATVLRGDVDRLVGDLRRTLPPQVEVSTVQELAAAVDRRSDEFYERFEDAMRGSEAAVTAALTPYLDVLREREAVGGLVLDIGSGRGEWLQILAAAGVTARGVDTNEKAVEGCLALGLDVILGDAIAYLRELPHDSLLAVTGFHLIEHLPVEFQRELAQAALGALRPGGVLILETPNPTNLNVGAASFWLDPTHLRPVNPAFLAFLLSDVGYVGVETRFLHPRDGYQDSEGEAALADELMWALRGPQDYAVLGVKPASATIGRP